MTVNRAQELVEKFNTKSVLIVGDVMLDRYIHGSVTRLNPEAPVPILNATTETEMTGGAGNVAKNIATLGATARLVAVSGSDSIAERVKEAADREKYQLYLVPDEKRPTTQKIRYVVGSQQLLRVDYEETLDIPTAMEQKLLSLVDTEIKNVDGIVISDYAKGAITQKVATHIIDRAQQAQILAGADVKPSRSGFLSGVTFVSPNEREAYEFLGLNWHQNRLEPTELASRVHVLLGCEVFLTLGARGICVCVEKGKAFLVPQVHQVEVSDPSGAGDTVMATLMLARLCGATPAEAAELANAAGAVVITKVGSVGVTQAEVQHVLSSVENA